MRSRACGTHNVYTDPTLLDLAGALAELRELGLDEDVPVQARSRAGPFNYASRPTWSGGF